MARKTGERRAVAKLFRKYFSNMDKTLRSLSPWKRFKSCTITLGNDEYLYKKMPSGTLDFLNVRAISKAVFDRDFTFTIPP